MAALFAGLALFVILLVGAILYFRLNKADCDGGCECCLDQQSEVERPVL